MARKERVNPAVNADAPQKSRRNAGYFHVRPHRKEFPKLTSMRNTLLGLHFLFAASWLGCVVSIAICERILLAGDRSSHLTLSSLHMRVDKFVEVPAILGVLVTGALLFMQVHRADMALYVMAGAGVIAIGTNLYCVGLVTRRHRAALDGRWSDFDRIDNWQHKVGAVVLVAMLLAFITGIWGRGAS